jgi:hypothetical protein
VRAEILGDGAQYEHVKQNGQAKAKSSLANKIRRSFPVIRSENKKSSQKKQQAHEEGLQVHLPKREEEKGTQLLMTHPGVGPVTALATDVFLGDPQRFDDGKSLASYARVAVARKLGIRLWIMLRDQIDYQEFCRRGQTQQSGAARAGMPEVRFGAHRHRPID